MHPSISTRWPGWKNVLVYPEMIKKSINLDTYSDNCLKWNRIDVPQVDGNYTTTFSSPDPNLSASNDDILPVPLHQTSNLNFREVRFNQNSNNLTVIVRNNLKVTVQKTREFPQEKQSSLSTVDIPCNDPETDTSDNRVPATLQQHSTLVPNQVYLLPPVSTSQNITTFGNTGLKKRILKTMNPFKKHA